MIMKSNKRSKIKSIKYKMTQTRVAIWPFKKLFARIKMVWPFGHFLSVDINSIIKGLFWTNLSKFQIFYEILNLNLVILTNLLKEIWPLFGLFSFFRIWPFLKLLMAQFGLFIFLNLAILTQTDCHRPTNLNFPFLYFPTF